MASRKKTILCHFGGGSSGAYGWTWVRLSKDRVWRDGAWWDGGRRVGSDEIRCPGPEGQKRLRRLMTRQRIRDPRRLSPWLTHEAFELDGAQVRRKNWRY